MSDAIHRNFDLDMPPLRTEEITFDLGGETFHCVPDAPGGLLPKLAAAIKFDERGRRVYQQPDLVGFIEDVLLEEREIPAPPADPELDLEGDALDPVETMIVEKTDDMDRWAALMADKKRPIPIELLGEIVLWLAGKYGAERPTAPSRR